MSSSLLQRSHLWRGRARQLFNAIVDVVLPPACAHCNQVGELLCANCLGAVQWLDEPLCQRCGRSQIRSGAQCRQCQQEPLPLAQVRAATLYAGPVPPIIHKMKYEGYFVLARPLAELMLQAWPKWEHPLDLVLPIPLHPQRQRERGYNQSELLVEVLSARLGWINDPAALKRIRRTRPQVGLKAADRPGNVRGAFAAEARKVAGKRILLVDDVCTSGSTLAAAAEVLLDAGAQSVSAYCLARAVGAQDDAIPIK